MEQIDKLVVHFEPTNEEKILIENVCNQIIDFMTPLSIPLKAFALKSLVDSFEDTLLSRDYIE